MPDALHIHLAVSHVPVMGVLFGMILLVWGMIRRSDEVKRASLALFIISALGAALVVATGEPAEERVEGLPGVTERAIEKHEDVAKIAAVGTYVLGGASLLALAWMWRSGGRPNAAFATIFVASIAVAALLVYTANLGGKIRHTELNSATAALHRDVDRD